MLVRVFNTPHTHTHTHTHTLLFGGQDGGSEWMGVEFLEGVSMIKSLEIGNWPQRANKNHISTQPFRMHLS